MITYKKIREQQENWGIDVTVQFTLDSGEIRTKTFRFDNEKQIEGEFESRMGKAVNNIQDDIDNPEKIDGDIIKEAINFININGLDLGSKSNDLLTILEDK